ncbi:hypothetical protein, partial [Brachyspira hyodysenteriae]|uniref:hypothetical protein n=1 Tax=Brachyspira hyodysenteriae TaxID=159 RepID=UPI001C92B617
LKRPMCIKEIGKGMRMINQHQKKTKELKANPQDIIASPKTKNNPATKMYSNRHIQTHPQTETNQEIIV